MLTLTRHACGHANKADAPQARLHIGDAVTVTILRSAGNYTRVGIDAPKGVRILRGEHWDANHATPPATDPRIGLSASPIDRRNPLNGHPCVVDAVFPRGAFGINTADAVLRLRLADGATFYVPCDEWATP